MPPAHLPISPAPAPTRKIFDPWNSSSTGHQRAENRLSGSTSWRASRTLKLGNQFSSSEGGGKRLYDTVGAGSEDFGKDGRKENGSWEVGAPGLREKGWRDIGVMMTHGAKAERDRRKKDSDNCKENEPATQSIDPAADSTCSLSKQDQEKPPQIFAGLTIYINGSTFPLISDHKLKHLLATHGANISLALGRRSVTHVILGKPNGSRGGGAGGGLSGSKLQKEVQRVGGKGIRFVGVEWVLESLRVGRRLGEEGFGVGGGVGRPVGVKGIGEIFGVVGKRKGEDEDGGGGEGEGEKGE
ncbi:hypothetical protein JMJ35_002344 [Cladonia borealis]|uniref:BRCT domain-containing protein n=1 Tax=Cladonia borealis TaxID=184061 RepID=A0AA39V9B1_9LECA|nr:hypothetical protein JMJ35_002344 [Cladonia borealis]